MYKVIILVIAYALLCLSGGPGPDRYGAMAVIIIDPAVVRVPTVEVAP